LTYDIEKSQLNALFYVRTIYGCRTDQLLNKKFDTPEGNGLSGLDPLQKEKMIGEFVPLLPMLRARLRMTQEELANRLGTTRQTIISIENGKRQLTWSLFLSMLFIFFMNPATRPFLISGDLLSNDTCKALFGDSSMLKGVKEMLDD
jgi:DNA-binding XRE family transcriptional regulator